MSQKRSKPSVPKKKTRASRAVKETAMPGLTGVGLLPELRGLIATTRQSVARGVNSALVHLYWQIGVRIRREILAHRRAEYGKQIVATLGRQLDREFGRGVEEKNLRRMVQFAEVFPAQRIVATLSRQLSWSHFKEILPLEKPFQRDFYAEMCRVEGWSVRMLRKKIDGMLYERTALSKKPAKLIKQELTALREADTLTPDLRVQRPVRARFPQLAGHLF